MNSINIKKRIKELLIEEKSRLLFASLLITLGVTSRVFMYDIISNMPTISIAIGGTTQPLFMIDMLFIVATLSIVSGLILGGYYTFIVPISAMLLSDIFLGNTYIFMYTWSGFAMLGLIGYVLKRKNTFQLKKFPLILGTGLVGVIIYDLWTNFGCWLGWYPKTLSGLATCYTFALPFMTWHLLSTGILLTVVILPILYLTDNKLIDLNYQVNLIERKTFLAIPIILILLSIFSY